MTKARRIVTSPFRRWNITLPVIGIIVLVALIAMNLSGNGGQIAGADDTSTTTSAPSTTTTVPVCAVDAELDKVRTGLTWTTGLLNASAPDLVQVNNSLIGVYNDSVALQEKLGPAGESHKDALEAITEPLKEPIEALEKPDDDKETTVADIRTAVAESGMALEELRQALNCPAPDECASIAECAATFFESTDGTAEEEEREDEILDALVTAEALAVERGYGLGNTTCEMSCVLRGGLKGETAEELALDLVSKGVMSPALLDDAARSILDQRRLMAEEAGEDTKPFEYTDERPVGDLNKAATDSIIVYDFFVGSTATQGTLKVGTKIWNTVVDDGSVRQFEYTVRTDRQFVEFEKDGVTLMFFDSCGNRASRKPVRDVPIVPEPPDHDDAPPTSTPREPAPTTTTTQCVRNPETGKCHLASPVTDEPNTSARDDEHICDEPNHYVDRQNRCVPVTTTTTTRPRSTTSTTESPDNNNVEVENDSGWGDTGGDTDHPDEASDGDGTDTPASDHTEDAVDPQDPEQDPEDDPGNNDEEVCGPYGC